MLKNFMERTGTTHATEKTVTSVAAKIAVSVAGGTLGWMLAYL